MKILSDSSQYSRTNLSDAIIGQAEASNRVMVEQGSHNLLKALWRSHPDILRYQAKCGRQVAGL